MADVDDELINAPFYHGFQTRTETDVLLPSKNGSFLVRLVQDYDEMVYVVSVYWQGIKHHYRIYQTEHKNYYFLNGVPIKTIPELIRFHRFTQTPVNKQSGARIRRIVERTHYALAREQLTLEDVIGHGEFGEVRRAKLQGFLADVDVAVKMMISENVDISASERIKFLREANLMMRLRHKNVIRLFGVVIYNDPVFIVAEFAEGGCLLDRLQQRKPREDKIAFARDICFGMAYLENQCVIHRDLAARNCLLAKNDCVKISDFGLSLQLGTTATVVKKGRAPIRYCPPETLKDAVFSNKSDVWSYGVVLFEIWSNGEEPYADVEYNKELRVGIVSGNLRLQPPCEMPPWMAKLMRCTHSDDPNERPDFAKIALDWFGGEEGPSVSDKCSPFLHMLASIFYV